MAVVPLIRCNVIPFPIEERLADRRCKPDDEPAQIIVLPVFRSLHANPYQPLIDALKGRGDD